MLCCVAKSHAIKRSNVKNARKERTCITVKETKVYISYGKEYSIPCAALSGRDHPGDHCFLLILFRKKSNKVN